MMLPHRLAHHPLALALATALQRITDIPAAGWVWGILVSFATAVVNDIFTWIYVLAGLFGLGDVRLGARVAHEGAAGEPYSADRKRRGLYAKIIMLGLLLGLRGAEWWATSWGLLDVPALLNTVGLAGIAGRVSAAGGGVVSALIAAAVWWDEMQSWETHRLALGGARIPVWTALLRAGRAAERAAEARITAAAKSAGAGPGA